ncbi:histidine kinase [Calothrix parasitica NIES-267]|uniref:Circadian input-output histidine kinase CikA n=1 Tax=Calothrix parasitica NIES-267 TaxID=1973488 RepID=A0A1Z4LVU6_9CYAN|nr:histidine kinase [Calothrix parasitica NIES-267]
MSKDLGQALLAKTEVIIENWIAAIRDNVEDIESSRGLAYKSVRNSIPLVLEALATLLSQSLTSETQELEDKGLKHGIVRAEQGYDVTEILVEYGLLRKVIFAALKPDLLLFSGDKILETVEKIDTIIDEVVSLSLESYVEERLKELQELQSQLILNNQELNRLVAMQKESVSYLAHELKSPLNSIMGFSSILLKQQQKIAQGQDTSLNLKLTEKVIKNGRQLLRLINDTLEISRINAGKVPLNLEWVDVASQIKMIVEAMDISAREKNLEVIMKCDSNSEKVLTDPLRLQQIITNLFSNAIRYTSEGNITITYVANNDNDNDYWSIIISDTGIGISEEAQAQIFESYFRVGTEASYSPNSTGLGLTIVEKLVKLLKGKIDLVSKPKEGSTFTITFPKETTLSS